MATDHAIVLWTLTPVEVASAVRRLVREGVLDEDLAHGAEGRMDDIVGASQAEGHSQGRHFYTLDRRLAVAAQREGFIVPS
jgi:predicted nucleic acid-binding protein